MVGSAGGYIAFLLYKSNVVNHNKVLSEQCTGFLIPFCFVSSNNSMGHSSTIIH